MKNIVWDTDQIPSSLEIVKAIGGKAIGLHELKSLGIAVPTWATITSLTFKDIYENDVKLKELFAQENIGVSEKAKSIRDYFGTIGLGKKQNEIAEIWERISEVGKYPVAVRSSAADEDGKVLSFAGQMDTFLNIRDREHFLKTLRGCWASLFSERAVFYRLQHKLDPWSAQIAVIVQRMIESEISGVIFTVNPLNGNIHEMLISSTWGLGEGLVSGALDADTFVLDSEGRIIKSEIAEKKQRIVYAQKGGTGQFEVNKEKQNIPCLTEEQLRQIHFMALQVQELKGMPMDIEFAILEGKIIFLQARPITNLKESVKKDNFNVWDNSNIVESYSGVTTPLTFTFIRNAYYAVYWQFCETIGIDQKTIFKSRPIFDNMLGLIQGRVYYNLLNWYRLVSLMPGFKYNRRFMEQMMGLQVIKDFNSGNENQSTVEKYVVQLPRLVVVGMKMLLAHLTLPNKIEKFHNHFSAIYSKYSRLDLSTMTPAQIMSHYRTLEEEILWKWKAPITNDFEAMIFYGLLKSVTVKWGVDPQGTLQNALFCNEGGIKSTQVTTQLFRITREIEKDDKLKTAFLESNPRQTLARLRADPCFTSINESFQEYLREYGVRCINEMKLESIPIKDDPLFCIAMMQNYLRNRVPDPDVQQEHEKGIRVNAEKELKERLSGKFIFGIVPRLAIYNWILKNARKAIKNRENQRFARTEAYSLIRNIFREIGRQWAERGIIEKTEDIFYLEMKEIWSFIEGTSTCVSIKELIRLRKQEFEKYLNETPDDHLETFGEVYTGNLLKKEEEQQQQSNENLLTGLGCCSGIVEKEVRVVLNPDQNIRLNGEIMVARQTDPGWVVLFPSISGLIVEKGSMLSHSAIVAREMGIPAVVGVKKATTILKNGDQVRLNGAEGTINILERAGK